MTIETQSNKVQYVGNGVAAAFPVPFPAWKPEHLHLYVVENRKNARQTEMTTGFTITGAAPGSKSVSVTLTQPLAKGTTLTILRRLPYTQPMDLANGGAFNADTLEGSDDNLEMQIQQLAETMDRAILAPESLDGDPPTYQDLEDLLDQARAAADRAQAAADTRGLASGAYNVRIPWIAKTAVASGGVLTLPGNYYPTRDVLMLWYQGAFCSPRTLMVETAGAYQYEEIGTDRNILSNTVKAHFPISVGDLLDMYVVSSAAGLNLAELEDVLAEAINSRTSAAASATAAANSAATATTQANLAKISATQAAASATAAQTSATQAAASAAAAQTHAAEARASADSVAETKHRLDAVEPRLTAVELSADNSQAYIWVEAIANTRLTGSGLKRSLEIFKLGGY